MNFTDLSDTHCIKDLADTGKSGRLYLTDNRTEDPCE
jgi:hypothetical protein